MRLSVITAILLSASCHADEEAIVSRPFYALLFKPKRTDFSDNSRQGSFHPDGGCVLSSAFYIWANRCGNTGFARYSDDMHLEETGVINM